MQLVAFRVVANAASLFHRVGILLNRSEQYNQPFDSQCIIYRLWQEAKQAQTPLAFNEKIWFWFGVLGIATLYDHDVPVYPDPLMARFISDRLLEVAMPWSMPS